MTGYITALHRFSMNDGPGIRTIAFFAGCAMSCKWCQNPETGTAKSVLMFDESKCIGCGACAAVCESGACAAGAFKPDREKCVSCLKCVPVCFAEARKPSTIKLTAEELASELAADEVFFKESGGGVTLSGGEPLLQRDFAVSVLKLLKERGVHTAVETAGYYDIENIKLAAPYIDLFLFDLKFMDNEKQKRYTGVSNEKILKNFEYAAKNGRVILRVALIPNVNDGEEFEKIALFAKSFGTVSELHILPFHNLGDYKYAQLGAAYPMKDKKTENEKEIERCAAFARALGFAVSVGGAGTGGEDVQA